jgi:hypothetical protein
MNILFPLMFISSCFANTNLEFFIDGHLLHGTHNDESVPSVIRGNNFTKNNLIQYFDDSKCFLSNFSNCRVYKHNERILSVGSDEIISVGKEAWQFIQDNKPVVNVQSDYTGAVPNSVTDWRKLSGWKNTEKGPFTISWINGFNTETVKIDFKWASSYGANLNNKGKYVTQAGPVIGSVDVSWGYTVDVHVSAFNPLNVGTLDNPVSQIDVELTSRISTVLKDVTNNCRVRFVGDGSITTVHCNLI